MAAFSLLPSEVQKQITIALLRSEPPRIALPDTGSIERRTMLKQQHALALNCLRWRSAFPPFNAHNLGDKAQDALGVLLRRDVAVAAYAGAEISGLPDVEQLSLAAV